MDFTTKTDILVFFANAIDTVGEDGSNIKGCTIHYVFINSVSALTADDVDYDILKPVGMQRGKSWVDYGMRDRVRVAPAIYEGTFNMSVGSDGKTVLKLVDISYKSHVCFVPYLISSVSYPGMLPCDAPSSYELKEALARVNFSPFAGMPGDSPAEDSPSGAPSMPADPAGSKPGRKSV